MKANELLSYVSDKI